MCTPMFIAGLFTISKIWKQPKCPSTQTNGYTHTHTHTHTHSVDYCSAITEEGNFAICSNMDGLRGCDAK